MTSTPTVTKITFAGFAMFFALLCYAVWVKENPFLWLNSALVSAIDWAFNWLPSTPSELKVRFFLEKILDKTPSWASDYLVNFVTIFNRLLLLSFSLRVYKFFHPFK